MLRSSATFRRQIAVLTAKPAVRMSVIYGGMRGDRNYHAVDGEEARVGRDAGRHDGLRADRSSSRSSPTSSSTSASRWRASTWRRSHGARASASTTSTATTKPSGPSAPARSATREYQDGADSLQQAATRLLERGNRAATPLFFNTPSRCDSRFGRARRRRWRAFHVADERVAGVFAGEMEAARRLHAGSDPWW